MIGRPGRKLESPACDRLAIVRSARTRRHPAMRSFLTSREDPRIEGAGARGIASMQALYEPKRRGRDSNPRWTNQAHNGFRDDRLPSKESPTCRGFESEGRPCAIGLR